MLPVKYKPFHDDAYNNKELIMHYVYRLLDQLGDTKYVGYTKYPNTRLQQHTKELPDNTGFRGKFYGQDLSIEILGTFNTKAEALVYEGEMKHQYGFDWTERFENYVYTEEQLKRMSEGGKRGGSNSHKNGTSKKQLEQLARVRDPQKAANARPKAICPHCGKEGLRMNMKRWHFDNCRHKKG
jgi:predicted GIY-YIG superfamily endonuclease